ncbi:Uncharacterized protein HZ326_19350 [Fusarium oxysporum f. sp. albedinis]|nr:Uncharacterized protein HZ326_19350 [Fusarium oxysporum f. sp. albedinis]
MADRPSSVIPSLQLLCLIGSPHPRIREEKSSAAKGPRCQGPIIIIRGPYWPSPGSILRPHAHKPKQGPSLFFFSSC